ncbi:hypothetical protein GWK41_04665 [Persephonella atlantica]|uniref:Uncharacterized protein n=1 Tax=Persephonella atlantica TaxID=2699429 RepID=A0ABS1GHF4_9AQUI|nr:hypothetical protein [Persephonella atlantica]MBK3332359.1 hypothetical protein [Persephonella atlantica]
MNIRDYIVSNLKQTVKGIKLNEERYTAEQYVVKDASLEVSGKKIKLRPVSFNYTGNTTIEGELVRQTECLPHIALKDFSGKILYVEHIDDLSIFHHIIKSSPSAVITNTPIKKPLNIKEFPVFYIPSILNHSNAKIKMSVKRKKVEFKNFFFDLGVGAYFVYLHFPFDHIYSKPDSIEFYSSFQAFLKLIKKLIEVKHPRGYRTRVLISDMQFSSYLGFFKHMEKVDKDRIISVFHIENCGLGNEKLILKNRKNLLDLFHYGKINKILGENRLTFEGEKLKEFSNIEDVNIPVIWLTSQPNENLYHLKKEFLNEKFIDNCVSSLFFIINRIYRER